MRNENGDNDGVAARPRRVWRLAIGLLLGSLAATINMAGPGPDARGDFAGALGSALRITINLATLAFGIWLVSSGLRRS